MLPSERTEMLPQRERDYYLKEFRLNAGIIVERTPIPPGELGGNRYISAKMIFTIAERAKLLLGEFG